MDILWFIFAWLFTNVIVKLVVNSVERIWKDRIGATVRTTPQFFRYFLLEIVRITLFVFFIPTILFGALIPFGRNSYPIIMMRKNLPQFLSRDRFHKQAPFIGFILRRPLALFIPQRGDEAIKQWAKMQRQATHGSNEKLSPPT
ncbi:MAG: hypothetical protein HYZ01_12690 [Ignavibacteriales bacterium]|nr:hypothetical protein [Ignavibacteriales bacterium]